MGELGMDSRPFPAPLPHANPVPFPSRPESRLRTNRESLIELGNTFTLLHSEEKHTSIIYAYTVEHDFNGHEVNGISKTSICLVYSSKY